MYLKLLIILLTLQLLIFIDNNNFCNGEESDTGEAEECINPAGKMGICIPLAKCLKLFRILKEYPLQLAKLKFLQKATCNYQHEEPWVCCETKMSTEPEPVSTTTIRPRPSPSPTTPKYYPPPSSTTTIPPPPAEEEEDEDNTIQNHPNRRLLPDIKTCGTSLLTDRIIGGTDAGLGTYPWMALLAYLDPSGEYQYACGGTIISSRYVLTASHCVSKLPEGFSVAFIRLGEYDRKKNPDCLNGLCAPKIQDIPVEKIIPHEKFDATGRTEHDIALIRLKNEISLGAFTTPVCLPQGKIVRHKLVRNNRTEVAGWGRFKFNSEIGSDILQHIYVPVQTTRECNAYYSRQKIGNVDETRFCAGGEKGKDSCQGDSGGPIMETIFDEKRLQAQTWQFGIVSLGPNPCGSSHPALYTNVSHYMTWILDHMRP